MLFASQATLTAFQDSRPEAPRTSARNPYGIELDDEALRWAAAEGVPASVIAAICLLLAIGAKLSPTATTFSLPGPLP